MKNPKIYPLKINFEIPVSPTLNLPRFVYLFIIEGEKLHLIDSGVAPAFSQIVDFLATINRNITDIRHIFLTHSHPDHIGAAKLIQEKANCTVYAPKDEADWIEDTALQYKNRPVPGFHHLVAGPVHIQKALTDTETIQVEKNTTLKVISTPGHSAGSTSFYMEEENILFCGDAVLLPGEIPIFEDVDQYLESLEKIRALNPDILYSSWDKPRKSGEILELLKKSKDYILSIQKTAQQVAKKTSTPYSMEFCRTVLKSLGLNEKLANPLLLKSFLACLNG